MRLLATIFALALAIPFVRAASWQEQLALARENEDRHAQIELIRRLLDQDPKNPELHDELVTLWLALPDYDMAESALQDWKDAPEDTRASVTAAILFHRDEKKKEAIALLENYHAKHPDDLAITQQLTTYLKIIGDNEAIVALLKKAPGVDTTADLLVERSLARRNLDDLDGALADFAAAEAVSSTDSSVTNNRGAYDRLKNALPNIRQADAILAKDPHNLAALIDRAYWQLETGFGHAKALADATQARELAPHSVGALILYVEAANRAGKLTSREALEQFNTEADRSLLIIDDLNRLTKLDETIAKKPRDEAPLVARAALLNNAAVQYQLAVIDADSALALDPKNSAARVEKIFALIKLGRQAEAAAELKQIESANFPPERFSQAYAYFAEAAFRAEKFTQALDYASRAIKAKSTATLYKLRAATFQRLYRTEEAQADLAKASQLEKKK